MVYLLRVLLIEWLSLRIVTHKIDAVSFRWLIKLISLLTDRYRDSTVPGALPVSDVIAAANR